MSGRRPTRRAAVIVGALVSVGTAASVASDGGTLWRELGLALLSGGIVGGALVAVESSLARAAAEQGERAAFLQQLTTTGDLNGIDLADQRLAGIYLPGRAMVAARMRGTDLRGAMLVFGDLRHADLRDAVLDGIDLRGATLAFARAPGVVLTDARLDDADLSDADLTGARLADTSLAEARLQRTNLVGADLSGARLARCYLEGADLTGASLDGITIEDVQYDSTTRWPDGFTPPPSTTVVQDPIADMDLAVYLASRAARSSAPARRST